MRRHRALTIGQLAARSGLSVFRILELMDAGELTRLRCRGRSFVAIHPRRVEALTIGGDDGKATKERQ